MTKHGILEISMKQAVAILRCGRSYDEASKASGIPVTDIMEAYQKAIPKYRQESSQSSPSIGCT